MRGVLRYRQIPFRWVLRDSKWDDLPTPPVPIIPVIVYPNPDGSHGEATVDSSPQIMRLEDEFSGRSLVPSDPALAFIDCAHRGLRRRVGHQGDVPLPVGLRSRHRQGRSAPAAVTQPAAEQRPPGSRCPGVHHHPPDRSAGTGRLDRAEPADHRELLRTAARHPHPAVLDPRLPARRPPGPGRLRDLRPVHASS